MNDRIEQSPFPTASIEDSLEYMLQKGKSRINNFSSTSLDGILWDALYQARWERCHMRFYAKMGQSLEAANCRQKAVNWYRSASKLKTIIRKEEGKANETNGALDLCLAEIRVFGNESLIEPPTAKARGIPLIDQTHSS